MKIDKSTVYRHAKIGKAGLVYRSASKKPLVTNTMKAKRVNFCKSNQRRDWKKVVFSDSKIWVF
jgi:hypothetical protein